VLAHQAAFDLAKVLKVFKVGHIHDRSSQVLFKLDCCTLFATLRVAPFAVRAPLVIHVLRGASTARYSRSSRCVHRSIRNATRCSLIQERHGASSLFVVLTQTKVRILQGTSTIDREVASAGRSDRQQLWLQALTP